MNEMKIIRTHGEAFFNDLNYALIEARLLKFYRENPDALNTDLSGTITGRFNKQNPPEARLRELMKGPKDGEQND